MRIVFLGTPEFAIPSLENLIKISWIELIAVCTQTDKEAGRGKKIQEPPIKKLALANAISVLQTEKISKEVEVTKKLKDLKPEVIVSCAYGQILNEEILNIAPHGVINVHPSLLPKYRGAAPINWAILNGENETGVTIMKAEIGLDSGPILLQERCKINENESSIELSQKLSILGAKLLIKALEVIKNGNAKYIKQDDSKATKAPALTKELGLIDWNKKTREIHNKIRGLQPWPSAYTHYNGITVKIWGAGIDPSGDSTYHFSAGTIVEIGDYIKVKTGDGFININKLQSENKKILNSKDWVNGARVKVQDRFE